MTTKVLKIFNIIEVDMIYFEGHLVIASKN